MIEVKRIYDGIRTEGLNFGIPMTFLELGEGKEYTGAEQLLGEIIHLSYCRWICIKGESTTRVGMGTLTEGLRKCLYNVEIEIAGERSAPNWKRQANWIVDYTSEMAFDLTRLNSQDSIRFNIKNKEDLDEAINALSNNSLVDLECTRYMKLSLPKNLKKLHQKEILDEAIRFVRKKEKTRIYVREI